MRGTSETSQEHLISYRYHPNQYYLPLHVIQDYPLKLHHVATHYKFFPKKKECYFRQNCKVASYFLEPMEYFGTNCHSAFSL